MRVFPFAVSSGSVTRFVTNGVLAPASALGIPKSNANRFMPSTNSLVVVEVGFQCQFTARLRGDRRVSTEFGRPGNLGEPEFAYHRRYFDVRRPSGRRSSACR